ncbi:MAG: hypothetical protein NC433_01900 [Clostridiales bacterium]|nr:hypothetical protein [Clostridiales bacterium]
MTETANWIEAFRTQKKEDVYVLTVTITDEDKKEEVIKEVVDCPKGEVGAWYGNNLLFRLANEKLKDTELETIEWEDRLILNRTSDKDYSYMKMKGLKKRVLAEIKYYQELPKEY